MTPVDPALTQATASVIGTFLQYGLLGALSLIEAFVIYKMNAKIDAKDVRIAELHQARLDDQKQCSVQHVDMMTKQYEINGKTTAALEGIERLIDVRGRPA